MSRHHRSSQFYGLNRLAYMAFPFGAIIWIYVWVIILTGMAYYWAVRLLYLGIREIVRAIQRRNARKRELAAELSRVLTGQWPNIRPAIGTLTPAAASPEVTELQRQVADAESRNEAARAYDADLQEADRLRARLASLDDEFNGIGRPRPAEDWETGPWRRVDRPYDAKAAARYFRTGSIR